MKINNTDKILVTGGRGFLGKHVVQELKNRGYEDITIAPPSSQLDLRNKDLVEGYFQALKPDGVIHLAAFCGGIGKNQENPNKMLRDNISINMNVLDSFRNTGGKLVAVGSVCSYPKNCPVPFKEEDLFSGFPEETNSPYGIAKRVMLMDMLSYGNKWYKGREVFLMPANLYGPGDGFFKDGAHVIPDIISKIHTTIEAKKAYQATHPGDKYKYNYLECWGDGSPTREFLYVQDASRAIVAALEKADDVGPYNIGNGVETSIKELVEKIAEIMKFDGEIRWDANKPNGQPKRCLNVNKAKEAFGFKAEVDLDLGLNETILWFKELVKGKIKKD